MASTFYAALLIILLSRSIEITKAAWEQPAFLKPDPQDKAIWFFSYNENVGRVTIDLEEEVNYAVCVAILNYKDDSPPTIGPFSGSQSNIVLGAALERNESTKAWSLWVKNKQDYETPIMREYRFTIIQGSSTYQVAINIRNINDNPPVIRALEKDCKIEENVPGPSNCHYSVTDADGSIHETVIDLNYPENFQFVTTAVSGENADYELAAFLNVTKSLDFETISMYMLLIRAVDAGNNTGELTAIVRVIDMPDMPPYWTRITPVENVLEKSTKAFNVVAKDGDIEINAEINYRITADSEDANYFTVDEKSGSITIHEIDRDARKKEIFQFKIIAYEKSDEKSYIEETIMIIVQDINDHSPVITPTNLKIEIEEEKSVILDFNPRVEINDPDLAENAQYSVSLTDQSKHNWSSAFLVVPTSGYQQGYFTISVGNASLLDYEDPDWRKILIQLQAIELKNQSHVGTRDIYIDLINLNDELPIFDENTPSNVSLPEDVEKGFFIATMHATDRDVDDNVTHSLIAQQALTIDDKNGSIVTNKSDAFDYESMPTVVVQVIATDLAEHKTYATLVITVTDVNDVPPKLHMPRQSPYLEEELPAGTQVNVLINATDVDTEAELNFSIDWENSRAQKSSIGVDESKYRGCLEIKTDWPNAEEEKRYAEGKLYVANRVDYEAFDIIFLAVCVTDATTKHNDNTTCASLTINIEDKNDNSPIFSPFDDMEVTENQIKDAQIGTVKATDADGPKWNKILYKIEPINGTKTGLIAINETTGVIKVDLDKGIDAEEYEYIYYNITAINEELFDRKTIAIFVIDQNDNEPYLTNEDFGSTRYLKEKSQNGTDIVTVMGKDDDRTTPFNNVSYLIDGNSVSTQYFSIEKYTGRMKVDLTEDYILDRDYGPSEFTLNLKLRDNYLVDFVTANSLSFDTTIKIILLDINDQKPILPDYKYPANISENAKKGDLVCTIEAKDDDDPKTNNTKVFYKILNISPDDKTIDNSDENYKNLFYVETSDEKVAYIYANSNLRGFYGRWIIDLNAQDRGTDPGPLNHTNSYVIQVTDFNYDVPEIQYPNTKRIALRKEQTIHAQLRTYDDQLLTDFNATDKDYGESGTVEFHLSSTSGDNEYFEMVSMSKNVGRLRLAKIPNVEEKNSYTINLIARDRGDPAKEDSRELTVIFITKSGPKFDPNEMTIWVKENKTGVGHSLIIPEAHDMLSEEDGNVVDIYYFFKSDEKDNEYFALNKTTRNLTLIKELDREEQQVMTLWVIATTDKDGPPRNPLDDAVLKITVVVLDVNDNPPIFQEKMYRGGVTMEDRLDKNILTIKATDKDLNDTQFYSIVANSLTPSHSSLGEITDPFAIDSSTGILTLRFTVLSTMEGYFKVQAMVRDEENHSDTTSIEIYVVPESSRVIFTFNNLASYVQDEKMFVMETFGTVYGYLCNIDDIKATPGVDVSTSLTTHFINPETNLPISNDAIILSSSNLQTITDLKAKLLTKNLRLTDVPTGSANTTDDAQNSIQWIFVTLTIFFGICSIGLLSVYIIKTRRMNETLNKLAVTKYGSQESGMDQAGIVPTTNQFSMTGSNPIWKTTGKSPIDDNISQRSGDSDLIGIEDKPEFGYTNEAMMAYEQWEYSKQETVNPMFGNREVTSRNNRLASLHTPSENHSGIEKSPHPFSD